MVPCFLHSLVLSFFRLGGDEVFDAHYDLLSISYVAYLKNDYSYLEKIAHYFYDSNVVGVIANLYFMSKEEMSVELHPNYYQEDISVLEMFKIAKDVLDAYLPSVDILYSIEGADYIKDSKELEELYKAGLDCLILCWNTQSKYASGNRSDAGLTKAGKELLETAISLGLGIDLSHANEKTFYDMMRLILKKRGEGIDVCFFASHSNARRLCDRKRNLTDDQLKMIADAFGVVGVFSNRNFCVPTSRTYLATEEEQENFYMKHIAYIMGLVGKNSVMLATDDMSFCGNTDLEYAEVEIYDYATIGSTLRKRLVQEYGVEVAQGLLYSNAKRRIFDKLRDRKTKRGVK